MAAFGDRIQALMDEVYDEWRKEENNGKGKWDVLDGFSAAHQIAVIFGNFNYQVENGGLEQWIYNGYLHDDAEKFIDYLEIGAESDERCRTILDRVYKLDQYAQETGCDRYGNFSDPDEEDGESGFIGDIANCDAFDTWYYEHCGKDDWWEIVGGIIDKVEGRDVALSHEVDTPEDTPPQSDNLETGAQHPLRVYIENARDERIGGFTMPLPAKPEDLRPFFESIGISGKIDIKICEVLSDSDCLNEAMAGILRGPVPLDTLDELNYLAVKIDTMQPTEYETFGAALEAKRHCGSVAELINLTENLDRFELEPAFDAAMLGEHLLDGDADNCDEGFQKLYESDDEDLRGVINYIETLEKYVDYAAYGKEYAENEQGVFTDQGYMTETGGFKEVYRGPHDIPAEYRVDIQPPAEEADKPLIMVCNEDMTALLLEMHALGGDYMRDAKHNLQTIANGGTDFFVMMNDHMLMVTPADSVFRRDMNEHQVWMLMNEAPNVRTFVMSVAEREDGRVTGNLYETALTALQHYVRGNSFYFSHLDAELKDGTSRRISLKEWDAMDRLDRDQLKSWTKHYDPADESRLETYLDVLRWAVEENRLAVPARQFLSDINAQYMARADNPQPDMLRVTHEAAQEMLARGDAEVYRLLPGGPEKLNPLDAMQSRGGLWYQSHREFAVKKDALDGLDKWANRAAEALSHRQPERDTQEKPMNRNSEI